MGLTFFKPNKANAGAGCEISFNSKDGCLFTNIFKQTGWNEAEKIGSFKGGEKCLAKFSIVEMGSLLFSIRNNSEYSTYHDSGAAATQILFGPYTPKGKESAVGYSLLLSRTVKGEEKKVFRIGFTFQELVVVEKFIEFALTHCFSAQYSADKEAFRVRKAEKDAKNTKPAVEEVKEEEAPQTEPEAEPVF